MKTLSFSSPTSPACVLLLGAHCDDIEIGCGGTILQMVERWPESHFVWVTLSSDPVRGAETRAAAARLLSRAHNPTIRVEQFRGSYFPTTERH